MIQLLQLPNELLKHIFSFLSHHNWHCVAAARQLSNQSSMALLSDLLYYLALQPVSMSISIVCNWAHTAPIDPARDHKIARLEAANTASPLGCIWPSRLPWLLDLTHLGMCTYQWNACSSQAQTLCTTTPPQHPHSHNST